MEWFKARVIWGASFSYMTDEEIGRFFRAVYSHIRDGEEFSGGSGREALLVYQAIEALEKDMAGYSGAANDREGDAESPGGKKRCTAEKRRTGKSAKSSDDDGIDNHIDNHIDPDIDIPDPRENANERSTGPISICADTDMLSKNKNKKKNKKTESDKESDKETEYRFARFWSAYPRKENKMYARKAFADVGPDEDLFSKMLEAVERQKQSPQWTRDGGQFIPLASSWLHARRWEDEGIEDCRGPGDPGTDDFSFLDRYTINL